MSTKPLGLTETRLVFLYRPANKVLKSPDVGKTQADLGILESVGWRAGQVLASLSKEAGGERFGTA